MSPQARTAFGVALTVAAVAGTWFLTLAIRQPYAPGVRGLLLGLAAGVFGVSVFVAGYVLGVTAEPISGDAAPRVRSERPTPDEAKFWLQRFLAEHQRKEGTGPDASPETAVTARTVDRHPRGHVLR